MKFLRNIVSLRRSGTGACEVDEAYRSACEGLDFYGEHENKRYCVLHYPGEEKNKEDFLKVKKSKLDRQDYDFAGTFFPEGTADFEGFEFDADAAFDGATFVGAANFRNAQFSGGWTFFRGAQFSGERTYFEHAQFSSKSTDFTRAQFRGESIDFSDAQFSGERTDFSDAQFSGKQTDFKSAQFSSGWTSFLGAQFSGWWTYFWGAQFSGKTTSFHGAQFSGETIDFWGAQFSGGSINFWATQFSGKTTSFTGAQFKGEWTSFRGAQFSGKQTLFKSAQFRSKETDFQEATFVKEVAFTGATFSEKVDFWGSKANPVFGYGAWAWFNRCRIEKPEQFTFDTVLLHPCWFIKTDVRKVDFTDVKWYGMLGGPEGTLDEEISALEAQAVESPHTLLSQACQRLAANAEENRAYPLANDFYYWSMEALRKAGWWRQLGLIRTIYWLLSGYGVKPGHAFGALVVIWVVFAALYVLVPSSQFYAFSPTNSGQVISDVGEATVYSLGTMARLNPEPKPDPGWFQFLVTVEGLLGPLQIALLLLAIRRKVMR